MILALLALTLPIVQDETHIASLPNNGNFDFVTLSPTADIPWQIPAFSGNPSQLVGVTFTFTLAHKGWDWDDENLPEIPWPQNPDPAWPAYQFTNMHNIWLCYGPMADKNPTTFRRNTGINLNAIQASSVASLGSFDGTDNFTGADTHHSHYDDGYVGTVYTRDLTLYPNLNDPRCEFFSNNPLLYFSPRTNRSVSFFGNPPPSHWSPTEGIGWHFQAQLDHLQYEVICTVTYHYI